TAQGTGGGRKRCTGFADAGRRGAENGAGVGGWRQHCHADQARSPAMTASIWTAALREALGQVKLDLRSQGRRWQSFTHVELSRMAKAKLIEECREWLARNA